MKSQPNPSSFRAGRGFVLVACLLLALLAAAGVTATQLASVVDSRISLNAVARERAFEAAEYGLHEALRDTRRATSATAAAPLVFPAAPAVTAAVPGAPGDGYAYRLHYEGRRDGPAAAAGLVEFHFVAEATGVAGGGATDTHVQRFYVLRAPAWTGDAAVPPCAECAAEAVELRPWRTSWLQAQAE